MADLVYPIGVQKILDGFIGTTTLDTTNCLFAVLVEGDYTASESHLSLSSVTTQWGGTAGGTDYSAAGARLALTKTAITATIASNKVELVVPNLAFGAVTVAGNPVAGAVIYCEDNSASSDAARWPLVFLDFISAVTPVASPSQSLTVVTNTNGIILWDPNA
jgi:hypothetical protein